MMHPVILPPPAWPQGNTVQETKHNTPAKLTPPSFSASYEPGSGEYNLTPAGGELSHWDNIYMWESSATVLPRQRSPANGKLCK